MAEAHELELARVLAACLSADAGERSAAEAALKQHEAVPGLVVALLRVCMRPDADMGVRQVAAIQFKNTVKRRWGSEEDAADAPALAEADRAAVRANLLEALMAAPHAVQVQLGDAFKAVAYADYPERWPALLPAVQEALAQAAGVGAGDLASPAGARLFGALYALRILARKYEFRDEEDRAPLRDVVAGTFPVLLALLQQLQASASPLHAKLVLKIFWSATFMGIPPELLQEEQFAGWMTCLHHALTARPPPDTPPDPSAPYWKMLKWVLHITYRMFSRYGEPKMAREGNDRAFAQLLQTHGGGRQLLEDHLALLARLAEPGAYLSPRVISLALQYVGRAVEIKESYALLKPHVDAMLTVVFPLTCFSEDDATLWDEDPQEYVRKGYDVVEDMYSTKTAAANLIHILVTKKPKAHMAKVMETIAGVFAQHAAAAPAVSVALARRMDGALLLVGSLSDVFKNKAPYKVQVETMLVTQVAPCFASPHGHLRSKAAWVAGCYSDIPFAAGDGGPVIGAGPNFMLLFERVINGMNDPELPVRVDSVVAMRAFVAELADVELLKPILPRLLESIFGLMAEVGSEDLVASLETIVEAAGEDIAPYAAQLAQNLTNAYWQYTTGGDEDDENDEASMAAYGCLRSLITLLDSCSSLKSTKLLPQLEEILYPLMAKLISNEGQDVIEEALELACFFSFYSDVPLSPRLWSLFVQAASCLVEFALEAWPGVLILGDNLISRDTATFLASAAASPSYPQTVFEIVRHSLTVDAHEEDILCAPRLACVVLQNCRGGVDQWLEPYLRLVGERLSKPTSRALRDELLVLVANALYYDAAKTLSVLGASAAPLFGEWFGMIFARRKKRETSQHFRSLAQKRAVALGLVSLLGVPDQVLPAELVAGMPQILNGVLRVLADFKVEEDERAKDLAEEDDDEEGGDDDGDDEEDEEDEGFAVVEADDVTQRRLRAAARSMLGGRGGDADDDDDDDDDSDDWGEEEEDAESPLDHVDPFVALAEAMQALAQAAPARAQALAAAGGQQLAEAAALAEVRRREAAEAEAKKAVST